MRQDFETCEAVQGRCSCEFIEDGHGIQVDFEAVRTVLAGGRKPLEHLASRR